MCVQMSVQCTLSYNSILNDSCTPSYNNGANLCTPSYNSLGHILGENNSKIIPGHS